MLDTPIKKKSRSHVSPAKLVSYTDPLMLLMLPPNTTTALRRNVMTWLARWLGVVPQDPELSKALIWIQLPKGFFFGITNIHTSWK